MIFGETERDLLLSTNNKEPVFGVQFGVLVDFYLNDRWSIQSGGSFFTMGSSNPYTELKLNYLNIPVNANWHFGSNRNWNLNFGLTPGILLSAENDTIDVEPLYEEFHLAFSFGTGYKIAISQRFKVHIGIQGLIGITNNLVDEVDLKRRNVAASFNIGGVIQL
jgi:hypothetical protein